MKGKNPCSAFTHTRKHSNPAKWITASGSQLVGGGPKISVFRIGHKEMENVQTFHNVQCNCVCVLIIIIVIFSFLGPMQFMNKDLIRDLKFVNFSTVSMFIVNSSDVPVENHQSSLLSEH